MKGPAPHLILGGGPAGLGAALAFREAGVPALLWESEAEAGGLAASFRDGSGFTWDLGGHVFFSGLAPFQKAMDEAMGPEMALRERDARVRFRGDWVPFPFQNHLDRLPPAEREACLETLPEKPALRPGSSFAEWVEDTYGPGLARVFFVPYNEKLWRTRLGEMSSDWVGLRVAPPALTPEERRRAAAWGPNAAYRYPERGGTGEPFRRLAASLPGFRPGRRAVEVDTERRTARTAAGEVTPYAGIVSTLALPELLAVLRPAPPAEVLEAAAGLLAPGMWVVGLGYASPAPDSGSWMYFPEPGYPFHRVTNLARHAPANLPPGGPERWSAWLAETSALAREEYDPEDLVRRVEAALMEAGLVPEGTRPVSVFRRWLPRAYPVPTRDRDRRLAVIQAHLMERGVLSRGRFGAWRYELGNMDHCLVMGREAARRLVFKEEETLWKS